jgi:membrane dipeptidase
MRRIIERDGVVGLVPYNRFLKSDWSRPTSHRDEVTLDTYIAHIDHICQLAGNSLHAGFGTDFDGGFGLQSIPAEMNTVEDLQMIAPKLSSHGYSEQDISNIFGQNWIKRLKSNLP